MPEASDKGSQPYSYPLGGCEMAGMRCNKNNSLPLGRRHGLHLSLTWAALVPYMGCTCPLPKGKVKMWASLSPAISRCLKARLYGWLPLSNAYGIIFNCVPITNLSIFPRCYLHPINQYFHVATYVLSINISTSLPTSNLSTFPVAKYTAY